MASLDLVYVNDRVIAMGFPVDKRPPPPPSSSMEVGGSGEGVRGRVETSSSSSSSRTQQAGNDMDVVAAVLRGRHAGHYMVWNVSEEGYDYSLFEDQARAIDRVGYHRRGARRGGVARAFFCMCSCFCVCVCVCLCVCVFLCVVSL